MAASECEPMTANASEPNDASEGEPMTANASEPNDASEGEPHDGERQ